MRYSQRILGRFDIETLTAELERRGFGVVSAKAKQCVDDGVVFSPETIEMMVGAVKDYPVVMRELGEARAKLQRAAVAEFWFMSGALDRKFGLPMEKTT